MKRRPLFLQWHIDYERDEHPYTQRRVANMERWAEWTFVRPDVVALLTVDLETGDQCRGLIFMRLLSFA